MNQPSSISSGSREGTAVQRQDIQALRGFAVLSVLLYHAKIVHLPGGYLGVDVFFVISGFLITGVVKGAIERGDFRFTDFYFRRAKRLLPAAYVTFALTALMAPLFLASIELADFRTQLIGSVAFVANFVLWKQSGYFGGAADLKPLLHIWSLAVEEQYYFLLPAALFWIPSRFWKAGAGLVFVASLALCLYMADRSTATFYLLPTRSWELAIGSIGALSAGGDSVCRFSRSFFWPALAVLVVLPVIPISDMHPGPDAVLICCATLVIILREHPAMMRWPRTAGLAQVGDFSYSLYLVHWPLFAFLNNSVIREDTAPSSLWWIRAGLVALSLVLGFALNHGIEKPIRRANFRLSGVTLRRTVYVSLSLILLVEFVTRVNPPVRNYADFRRNNQGFGSVCAFNHDFVAIPECRNSEAPDILVWGDSFAMHLVPGIREGTVPQPRIVQATRGECGPLLGIAPVERSFRNGANPTWARNCIAFNDSVITYLRKSPVSIVVLSTPLIQYVDDSQNRLLQRQGDGSTFGLVDAGATPTLEAWERTLGAVRGLGKRVIVVGPPPQADFDVGRCLERMERGMLSFGRVDGCRISQQQYLRRDAVVLEVLNRLRREAGVDVVEFDSSLCTIDWCETRIDGTFLYQDSSHLSVEGSVLLGRRTDLLGQIVSKAR